MLSHAVCLDLLLSLTVARSASLAPFATFLLSMTVTCDRAVGERTFRDNSRVQVPGRLECSIGRDLAC